MTALPALRELRALDVFDVVPAGHIAVLVKDHRFEPHLHPGEFAIVDTADKKRVFGELYVITIEGGRDGPKATIVELIKGFGTGNQPCTIGIWYAFSLSPDTSLGFRCRGRMVDGPLGFEHWPGKCRGRIVGVMLA